MRKRSTLFCLLSLLAFGARAQADFGKLVGGLEVGFDVSQLTDGYKPKIIPSIQLEVPIDRFAFGVGFGRKYYGDYEYGINTGQTVQREEGGAVVTYYLTDLRSFKPAYWTLPIKAEVRINRCRCVYLQAGMSIDFLDKSTPDKLVFRNAEERNAWPNELRHEDLIRPYTTTFSFGIGFNLFRTEGFRLIARPSIVWSENPEYYTLFADAPRYIPTLRMNFGAQISIVR